MKLLIFCAICAVAFGIYWYNTNYLPTRARRHAAVAKLLEIFETGLVRRLLVTFTGRSSNEPIRAIYQVVAADDTALMWFQPWRLSEYLKEKRHSAQMLTALAAFGGLTEEDVFYAFDQLKHDSRFAFTPDDGVHMDIGTIRRGNPKLNGYLQLVNPPAPKIEAP